VRLVVSGSFEGKRRRRCLAALGITMVVAIACAGLVPAALAQPAARAVRLGPRLQQAAAGPPSPELAWPCKGCGRPIRFEHLSVEQGLSQSAVHCILQDSHGLFWFATQDGLNKYNGYEFTVYRSVPGVNSLVYNYVSSIYEDTSGILWIATEDGLDRYDRQLDHFTHYQHDAQDPFSLSSDFVRTVYQDRQGALWIGTYDGGLDKLVLQDDAAGSVPPGEPGGSAARFIHYRYDPQDPHSLSSNAIWSIYEDEAGMLWIGTEQGLNRFDRETERFTRYAYDPRNLNSLSNNVVRAIAEDAEGDLWIGTDDGLNHFDRRTERFTRYRNSPADPSSLADNTIHALYRDREGRLWIGTDGGLHLYDGSKEQFVRYQNDPSDPHSLSLDAVRSVYQDREGVLWVGTYGGGLNKAAPSAQRFGHYRALPNNPAGLNSKLVLSLYRDRQGVLWAGTSGGLHGFGPDGKLLYLFQKEPGDMQSLSSDNVRALYQDREGSLWIGTYDAGLDRLALGYGWDPREARFVHYRHNPFLLDTLSSNAIRVIYQDREGVLWVGTADGGLNRFDHDAEEFTRYQHDDGDPHSLSHDMVWAIYEDREGVLWVGTGWGLNRFDRQTEQFSYYQHDPSDPRSLSHNAVLSICEDREGVLWIGTAGGGLNRFDREKGAFAHYGEQDGLPNNMVYGILEDEEGFLWLSTNKGLSRFDPRAESFWNYDVGDGLQSDEFNAGAYHKAPGGEMFFGGINGFNAFYPEDITGNSYVPPIVLTALTQSGEDVAMGAAIEVVEQVTFYWPNNFFEFEFAALSTSQPGKNQYAYRMEGLESEWNEVGTKRFGRYTNLPGGTYTLRIKGSNHDGVWNEEGITIKVTVVPPFWETWWFRGIVGLVLLGGVLGGYWLRVRSIQSRSRELAGLVEERTHALAQRTREIERSRQELEALYRADEELYRHLNLDQVLQALVDTAVEILGADKGTLMVWDAKRENLVVRAARGFSRETIAQISLAPGQGIAGHVAASGEPAIVEDARGEPRTTKTIIEAEGIHSFMQVPLRAGGEIFGVFSADYVQPRRFGEEERRLLAALAQRAAMAIENAQLYEQAQQLAAVRERNRLARDLHDSATQSLYAATLYADTATRLLSAGQEDLAGENLDKLRRAVKQALGEMRLLIFELRPPILEQQGLAAALEARLEAVEQRAGLKTQLTVEGKDRLPLEVEEGLYGIAMEALNNALKHARAGRIRVALRLNARPVVLEIADDGIGFDPATSDQSGGLGLPGMAERAAQLGGHLIVESKPGEGTVVQVQVEVGP